MNARICPCHECKADRLDAAISARKAEAERKAEELIAGPAQYFGGQLTDYIHSEAPLKVAQEFDAYLQRIARAKDIHEAGVVALQFKGYMHNQLESMFMREEE